MFIKYQKIVRNDKGVILSGSASLLDSSYKPNKDGDRTKSHSQQNVVEKLGKVLWVDSNNRNRAIFNSPTRGLVCYSLKEDVFTPVSSDDPRISGTKYKEQPVRIHTNFGCSYLFFSELEKTPFMRILRSAFTDQCLYKKVLAHLAHDCLRNHSSIKCGEFLVRNCLSHVLEGISVSILDCDTSYFTALSDDNVKVAYFSAVVAEMRKNIPEFGKCCYVDSTPLPGEAKNNPFNALSSHGTDGTVIQSRLVLILDVQTGMPVWFEIIPSNVLDKSTLLSLVSDIEATLGIKIDTYDLDAGYAREELFEMFNRENSTYTDESGELREHTVLLRMPASNGYPRDELYIQSKEQFYDPDYAFDYESHTFFGMRHEIRLFNHPEYAFVFVDKTQAEDLLRGWRMHHMDEWKELSKSAKEWYQVKDGFFVLIGNKDQTPQQALTEYRGRTAIEGYFRDGKAYLRVLPLAKGNKETVTGKILHDVIEITVYRAFRKQVAPAEMSMSNLLVCMNSWECVKISDEILEIKTPNLQVRETLEKLGYTVPAHLDLEEYRNEILNGVAMPRTPVTVKVRRKKKEPVPISPEEKRDAKEKEKLERAQRRLEEKARKQNEREEAKRQKAKEKAEGKKSTQTLANKDSSVRKKPGVPVGYKRGKYNKDGSLRKKPGPKVRPAS